MLPEQQQRILGYFIEEARDHLNTIEQGLLNLQGTLNDPEMVNEVFRAAHSIKGGAAMLGLSSIQHTSHRLEDCFKVLKEHPVQVDQKLESLFLGVSDTLKVLLEHLSGPFGLSEEAANTLMSETEPVFKWLNEHLEILVQQSSNGVVSDTTELQPTPPDSVSTLTELFLRRDIPDLEADSDQTSTEVPLSVVSQSERSPITAQAHDHWGEFQTQVLQALREMLQLFKQKTTPESRQNLQQCCQQLVKLGQTWNLPNWCSLCQAATNAIASPENTYLTLAKIVITEIKQAQELVLQGRETEITINQQLAALLSLQELDLLQAQDLFDDQPIVTEPTLDEVLPLTTLQPTDSVTSLTELTEEIQLDQAAAENIDREIAVNSSFFNSEEDIHITNINLDQNGPEVGLAELNTLADLFEGETPELDETWQEEEILDITAVNELGIDISDSDIEDSDGDLADFLSLDEDTGNDDLQISLATTEDLSLLFGDTFQEKENPVLQNQQKSATNSVETEQEITEISSELQETERQDLFGDLLALALDENELLSIGEVTQPETETITNIETSIKQASSADDLSLETDNVNLWEEISLDDHIESQPTIIQPETLNLDGLFTDLAENTLLSIDESEISDLFDESPAIIRESFQTEDDVNDFWNQEIATEQHEGASVVEQDVAKALEESLFAAAASGEIFGNSQESIPSPTTSFDLEDFDLTFHQPDLIVSSDNANDNDLFADLAEITSVSLTVDDEDPSLQEIGGFSQEPEALDFTPEFTNQSVFTQVLADLELDLFDSLDENPQILFNDTASTDNSTYIQLESVENPGKDEEALFSDISFTENLNLEQSQSELEFLDINVNASSTETTIEEITELDLKTDALAIATEHVDNDIIINDVTEITIEEITDLVAIETEQLALNLEAEYLTSETALVAESEAANLVLPEEIISATETETTEQSNTNTYIQDEFAELEALLDAELAVSSHASAIPEEDFADLEALLGTDNDDEQSSYTPQITPNTNQTVSKIISSADVDDEFSDLEKLLAEADQTISHSSPIKPNTSKITRSSARRTARFEETMKVPVKQLDDMSNLVGELVVNRNTLEQDHERLRQSLDNLLIQVQQLSDVGARMQELYERSLLEASLLASRKTKETKEIPEISFHSEESDTDRGFSELEMDRFTPFHTLSQEMIEFIVRVRESASDIDFVTEETERVARQFRQVTTQLQEGLTRARMVPFSQAIDRLRRGVRDNAIKYGKQVELVIEGGDTLIDKMILDHLTDPLTHMLNNAIAHGIETPEIRQAGGKQPVGYITIRAFHQGNQTVISVGDDGAGIDPERVKAKAVQMGMITAAQAKTISRMEVYDLLFQPGFSIKDKADEISGRGVGMDVVRSEISEIRGIVNTDSTIGKGTTFTIRLPLTLSICKALCCVSDKARIAFPMDGVEDTLDIPVKNIQHNADGQSYISWRDTVLPFRPLKELLTFNRQLSRGNVYGGNRDDDMVSVVVVRSGNTLIALQIDQVLSEQEIVIKQFESPAPKPIGVAGATVLGDGRIMPIADVLEIIDIFQGRISKHSGSTSWQQQDIPNLPDTSAEKIDPTVLIVDDSITVRELLSLTFNKAGYRVEQARDGQEAWDKLRSGLPCDIVFCDIEMPRCDGLELLSRIQKDSSLNHLPIAMLTSRGADKHRQMAIQLGASGYFTKPYLEEALLEAAVRMLKGEKLVGIESK